MSVIMPIGKKCLEWSPKDEKIIKEASTKVKESDSREALYQIAEKVMANQKKANCDEVAEKIEEVVEEVKEKVNTALDEVKNVVENKTEDVAEVEVEIEDKEDKDDEIEVEVEGKPEDIAKVSPIEVDLGDDSTPKDEIKVESNEVVAKSNKNVKATSDTFVKLSAISPETRKKIYTYYTEYLGYPKDYCALLVKDYEKK